MWQQHYQPPLPSQWQGRDDGQLERWHQVIKFVDATTLNNYQNQQPTFALLGFACDEGVKRNQGRLGAKQGPDAIRKTLKNLPWHDPGIALIDIGNITCDNDDLETAQRSLGDLCALLYQQKIEPLVIGGGHEVAWGHYQGIAANYSQQNIGIINFDAHFDLRPLLEDNKGSSGTPFLQIAHTRQQQQQNFDYLCIGIQKSANTASLFSTANSLDVDFIYAADIHANKATTIAAQLHDFIANVDVIYLTLCLDVFASSAAPGVSAPQALGLFPGQVMPLFNNILNSNKVIAFDIAEMAPNYDIDQCTAKLAAQFIFEYLHYIR